MLDRFAPLQSLLSYFARSPNLSAENEQNLVEDRFNARRWNTFIAITIGYSAFYICRYSWNVIKKPLIDEGIFDASQMGLIGSALFFTYAIGKLVNGILADHANVRRFMALGLAVSATVNLLMGFFTAFWLFVILWGINGWFQSIGAPSSVVTLSQWYGDKERGTFYGIWSSSHNIGGAASYIGTAFIVGAFGWQWGFQFAGIIGLIVAIFLIWFVSERPSVYGYEPVTSDKQNEETSVAGVQKKVFLNPYVWILALASACMYVARYAVDSWGIFFLQIEKDYSLEAASGILGLKDIFGIVGTLFSGVLSDRFFGGSRNLPALIFGLLYTASLMLFVWGPSSIYIDSISMIFFGMSLGVLLCFLGGLMAVDICPKDAAGTALGLVGVASYFGAALQDILSGYFIESNKTIIDSEVNYDFTMASNLWIGATIASMLLAMLVWNAQPER